MDCGKCGQNNGEMQDVCTHCGEALHATAPRKLKQDDSHPLSPPRKQPNTGAEESKVPSSTEESDDEDVKSMLKNILKEVKSVKKDIKAVKDSSEKALTEFKTEVKEDLARVETNVVNVTAEVREHGTQLKTLQHQFTELKGDVEARTRSTRDVVAGSYSAASRTQSAGPSVGEPSARRLAPEAWKPTKVTLSNFCAFGSNVNALTPKERDAEAKKIMDRLPADVAHGVSHEKKYTLTRQLVFVVPQGGEACWMLREALLALMEDDDKLQVKGVTDLKVRVEDNPERKDKRTHFFRALRALEKQIPREQHEEKGIMVDVRFLQIYAGKEFVPLGEVSVNGWSWDAEACTKTLGEQLDTTRLRRDSLQDRA